MGKRKTPTDATKGQAKNPRIDAQMRRDMLVALALVGTPSKIIAKELDIRADSVSRILGEPEVRARIEAARSTAIADGRADLQASTRWLTSRLLELAASRNGGVAVRAVVEALSKLGFDAPKRIDLGLLAGSTDDELWAKLNELRERRVQPSSVLPTTSLPADANPEGEPSDG